MSTGYLSVAMHYLQVIGDTIRTQQQQSGPPSRDPATTSSELLLPRTKSPTHHVRC